MTREIVAEAQKYAKDHGYEVLDKELLLAIELERKVSFRKGAQWMQKELKHILTYADAVIKELESENAALRQQVKDMGEVIKELKERLQELKHPF